MCSQSKIGQASLHPVGWVGITRENCSTQSKSLFPDVTLCSYQSSSNNDLWFALFMKKNLRCGWFRLVGQSWYHESFCILSLSWVWRLVYVSETGKKWCYKHTVLSENFQFIWITTLCRPKCACFNLSLINSSPQD